VKGYVNDKIYNRKKGEKRLNVEKLRQWINGVLLADYLQGERGISYSTTYNWLAELGYKYRRSTKNVYFDGHERPDVKKDRAVFVSKMMKLREKMVVFGGADRDVKLVPAELVVTSGDGAGVHRVKEGQEKKVRTVKKGELGLGNVPATEEYGYEYVMTHIPAREVPAIIGRRVQAGERGENNEVAVDNYSYMVSSLDIVALQQWHANEDEADKVAGIRRLQDDELLCRCDHDETIMKEHDDGGRGWEDERKGSHIKKKGEGRGVHDSDYISERTGKLELTEEQWGMAMEDRDAGGTNRSGLYGCREKDTTTGERN
jgi:hypothetical protein